MKTNYAETKMLDLIFENRNKQYGAYVLRSEQNNHTLQAMMLTTLIVIILCLVNFIAGRMHSAAPHKEVVLDFADVQLTKQQPIKPALPQKPVEHQASAKATVANTEKRVVAESQAHVDSIPTNELLQQFESGLTTNLKGATDGLGVSDATGTGTSIDVITTPTTTATPPALITAEIMPQFPGGEKALLQFVARHTNYPDIERNNGIEGKVTVRFVVNADGSITNAEVLKSNSRGFGKEAMRVVALLPKFSPGRQNGKAVPVQYVLPFYFKLND